MGVVRALAILILCGCVRGYSAQANIATYCDAMCTTVLRCGAPTTDVARCLNECPELVGQVFVREGVDYQACVRSCLSRPCGEFLGCLNADCI